MKKISFFATMLSAVMLMSACHREQNADSTTPEVAESPYECIAYVWEADGPIPPADMVTAINYLAAVPDSKTNGVKINNIERLKSLVDLKKQNPALKVLLSFGGAGTEGGWAEVTGDAARRAEFVADCMKTVEQYDLDGLDFDWEFPKNAEEEANYVQLFKEVREAIGDNKRVTAAIGFSGNGFDLKEAMKYLDYINLMSYDMGWQAPYHHTALRRSELAGVSTIEEAVQACNDKGLENKDIVLGLAFYGRGNGSEFKNWTDYRDIVSRDLEAEGMTELWDGVACVPYIVDSNGTLVVGYDNPGSLKIKCDYIKENGLRGGMYWRTELDTDDRDLTRTVARELMGR